MTLLSPIDAAQSGKALFTGAGALAGLLLALTVAGLTNGCLSRPSLRVESFIFAIPPGTNAPAPHSGRMIGISRLNIAGPFDSQSLVYRTGEFAYEHDPYAQFLVSPAESLRPALEGYLRVSGLFGAIAEPGSLLQANTLLEVYVQQLYGDFRKAADPAAVLELQLTFFAGTNGTPTKVLFKKGYVQRVNLTARTAAAVIAGWNAGLKRIMTEAVADFRSQVLEPEKRPSGQANTVTHPRAGRDAFHRVPFSGHAAPAQNTAPEVGRDGTRPYQVFDARNPGIFRDMSDGKAAVTYGWEKGHGSKSEQETRVMGCLYWLSLET